MADDTTAVRITNREIYESLQGLLREVSEIRSDIRASVQVQQQQAVTTKDHEDRLRALERRVWAIPGVATLVAIISLALQFLGVKR